MIRYTPSQLRADLQEFGITQKDIAGIFGVHHTNFSQWVNGGRPIPQYIQTGLWFYFEYQKQNFMNHIEVRKMKNSTALKGSQGVYFSSKINSTVEKWTHYIGGKFYYHHSPEKGADWWEDDFENVIPKPKNAK